MSLSNRLIFLVSLALCFSTAGCVAEKKSTYYTTLKGDNSVVQAMPKSHDLPDSGFTTLSDLTDRFRRDLTEEMPGKKVYLDSRNIRDINTHDVANFSGYLHNELEASLSKTLQLQVMPQTADIFLGATFQKYGNQVKVFFKCHSPDFKINKTFVFAIERARLPADSFKENLHSKAYQLAANIIDDDRAHKIYVKPFESISCKCVGDFSRAFANLVKSEIVRMHRQVEIVDERPVKEMLSNTRSIRKKATKVKNLKSSDAFFADADSVLEGEYVVNGDQVMVTVMLKGMSGHLINSTSLDIARSLITMPLEDKKAARLSVLADRKTEDSGNMVKLSTSRGGDYPVYHNGEKIVFYAQVKKPLYLYIYDINSKNEASLIYPASPESRHRIIVPGRLVTVPDDKDTFELYAEPPFGMDAVKVFASPMQLPIPTLSSAVVIRSITRGTRAIGLRRKEVQQELGTRKTINPDDLVDYYRGLARRLGGKVFEDSLLLKTEQ